MRTEPLNGRGGKPMPRPLPQTPASAAPAPQPEDVLRQTADFLWGELHRMFKTGVSMAVVIGGSLISSKKSSAAILEPRFSTIGNHQCTTRTQA